MPRITAFMAVMALGAFALGPAIAANINPPRGPTKPVTQPAPNVPAPNVPSAEPAPVETPALPPAAETDVVFEQVRPLTAAVLKEHFPDDYDSLVDQFAEIDETSATASERARRGAEAIMLIAQNYIEQVALGGPDTALDIVSRFVDLHEQVLAAEGPVICAEFSFDGSMVLYEKGRSEAYVAALDELGAVYFGGAADGISNPVAIEEALDADWAGLSTEMINNGAPDTFFESMARQDASDPELCPAMISMMKQLLTFGGEPGDRLRASFTKSAAVY